MGQLLKLFGKAGGAGGAGASYKSLMRQPVGNGNMVAYNNGTATNRFQYSFKRRVTATNANYSSIKMKHSNWGANGTSEFAAAFPDIVLRSGIWINGVTTPATYSSANEIVVPAGSNAETDIISGITLTAGQVFYEITRRTLPLLFKTQTTNFTVGQVVTGLTSGATGTIYSQTDSGTSGSLVLINETGTFVNNEAITDPLGGAALVDLTTTQNLMYTVSSHAWWNEGVTSNNTPATDYTVTHPVTYPVLTVTINGSGVITAVGKTSGGTGWTSAPSLVAFCWYQNILYSKTIGYCSISAGAINNRTVTSGTPPTGLAAWPVDTQVGVFGGTGFGGSTGIWCASLVSGIPSVPVRSLNWLGASQDRGDSASDGTGDMSTNHGTERLVNNRFGIVQMSRSSASAAGDDSYLTTYARLYALYMGSTTDLICSLGWNDFGGGAKTDIQVKSYVNTLTAYARTFGTRVDVGTILPHSIGFAITAATKAANCVITAPGHAFQAGYSISFGNIVGMTQLNNTTATVVSVAGNDITISTDSTGFSTYTSGGKAYYYATDEALQTAVSGWGSGGYVDLYNAAVRNGTMVSDNHYFDGAIFYAGVGSGKWRVDLNAAPIVNAQTTNNYESIHQNNLGYGLWAADATQIASLNYLV